MATPVTPRRGNSLRTFFRKDPFQSMQQEFGELLNRLNVPWDGPGVNPEDGLRVPEVDLSETDSAVQLTLDVPGVTADEINIDVVGNRVQISAEHNEESEEKGRTFHRVERRSASFARTIELPCAVKDDAAEAEYKNGVLTVKLPKAEEEKKRKIAVKS